MLALTAASAYLVTQTGAAPSTSTANSALRQIAGGNFQASGIAYVPGTNGVLFLDDDTTREIFWMELSADGRQRSPAVRVSLGADVTDLEGITFDGSRFYVVGSQSKTTGFDGDGLVRFRFDAQRRRITDVERVRGLKAWLAAHVPELKGTEKILGDEALNIEAIAWEPGRARLLLGLRAPVVDGKSLVIPLKLQDADGPLAETNLRVDGAAIRLPLGGAGIRSLEYDAEARAFRVITGAALNAETRDFRILEWNAEQGAGSPLRVLATFPRSLKPEGITRAAIENRSVNVVVFDVGRFALLSTR
jgi:hypothetical protein